MHHLYFFKLLIILLGGISMLQKLKFILLIGIFTLLLTACGTSNNQGDATKDDANESLVANESVNSSEQTQDQTDNQNTSEVEEQTTNYETETDKQENKDETTANQDEQTTNNPPEVSATRPLEQTIGYSLNGESKKEAAQLTKSDNQNYSLYVLSNFELTAEEPYKDLLFLSEDDSNSMRIEILPADTDLEPLKENTLLQLQVVNETVQTLDPPNDEWLREATIMEASNNGETVTAYLIPQKESIIKLTLFTKDQTDYRDAFIQMAKTIKIEE
jgi:FtsZ-interacting cell division protein ZipA